MLLAHMLDAHLLLCDDALLQLQSTARMLTRVRLDDCFLQPCPDRPTATFDAPAYAGACGIVPFPSGNDSAVSVVVAESRLQPTMREQMAEHVAGAVVAATRGGAPALQYASSQMGRLVPVRTIGTADHATDFLNVQHHAQLRQHVHLGSGAARAVAKMRPAALQRAQSHRDSVTLLAVSAVLSALVAFAVLARMCLR